MTPRELQLLRNLRTFVEEVLEYAGQRSDVVDGENGPRANEAMLLWGSAKDLKAALDAVLLDA